MDLLTLLVVQLSLRTQVNFKLTEVRRQTLCSVFI